MVMSQNKGKVNWDWVRRSAERTAFDPWVTQWKTLGDPVEKLGSPSGKRWVTQGSI
jgi:hypothetical protein